MGVRIKYYGRRYGCHGDWLLDVLKEFGLFLDVNAGGRSVLGFKYKSCQAWPVTGNSNMEEEWTSQRSERGGEIGANASCNCHRQEKADRWRS